MPRQSAAVIQLPQAEDGSLSAIAIRIRAAFAAYERGTQACASARLEAGRQLLAARAEEREAHPELPGFKRWCAVNVQRSWRDVLRCVAIAEAANPQAAIAAERATARAAMQVSRTRRPRAASVVSLPQVTNVSLADVAEVSRGLDAALAEQARLNREAFAAPAEEESLLPRAPIARQSRGEEFEIWLTEAQRTHGHLHAFLRWFAALPAEAQADFLREATR